MHRVLLVAAAVTACVFTGTAIASTTGWKLVAKAGDVSPYFASASLTKQVKGGLAARIVVISSRPVVIRGTVLCIRGFNYEDRTFAVPARGGGAKTSKAIPMPLRKANCTYILDGTLMNGGNIAMGLFVYF